MFAFLRVVVSLPIYIRLSVTLHILPLSFFLSNPTLYILIYASDPSLYGYSLFHVACNLFPLTLYEERTFLLLEMVGSACGCVLLRVFTPHYPGFDFLSGP